MEEVARLTAELAGQFKRSKELEEEIGKNLAGIEYQIERVVENEK